MAKQLAIMRDVHFGNYDVGTPVLWFSTYISEGAAALQVLRSQNALTTIEASGVYDVKDLEGMACWVDVEEGLIQFLSVAKI